MGTWSIAGYQQTLHYPHFYQNWSRINKTIVVFYDIPRELSWAAEFWMVSESMIGTNAFARYQTLHFQQCLLRTLKSLVGSIWGVLKRLAKLKLKMEYPLTQVRIIDSDTRFVWFRAVLGRLVPNECGKDQAPNRLSPLQSMAVIRDSFHQLYFLSLLCSQQLKTACSFDHIPLCMG